MKSILKITPGVLLALFSLSAYAQTIDDERMQRDLRVAENVLTTLVKHELGQDGQFFGFAVRGNYQQGYGVTFSLPGDHTVPLVLHTTERALRRAAVAVERAGNYYTFRRNGGEPDDTFAAPPAPPAPDDEETDDADDSVMTAYYDGLVRAAKTFILDYGDILSQLRPTDRIRVTNRDGSQRFFYPGGKRRHISVEANFSDVIAVRGGKLGRDQAMKRLEIVNAETVDKTEPDLEMLSSIFGRLYRSDLSDTYFVDGNVYYDRLKDFGAVYYMRVVSSVERGKDRYYMPTLKLENLTQQERDQRVAELYPRFEQQIKEHILEYGRTIKSLSDDESLIFNIQLTRCKGCEIPSTLELSLKGRVLKDYGAGKIDREKALSLFLLKKGISQ